VALDQTGRESQRISCPHCGTALRVPDGARRADCPRCGKPLPLDALEETLAPPEAAGGSGDGPVAGGPPEFAGYQIVDEVGRGGMGVVYRARDPRLDRVVALKVLRSSEHASPEEVARFRREASSTAKLEHPNIVRVYQLDAHEGQYFYAMEFVAGKPLSAIIDRGSPWGARRALELVEKVARGLHHAHRQGVIHRDVKPSNILIDPQGEPRLTDFGLARIREEQGQGETAAGMTRSGTVMGTPHYMAPEQAAGRGRHADARTDVYSLGCVLYELITGRPPFGGRGVLEVLRKQMNSDPPPPRSRGARVSADVETICLKCLEKDPARRYRSAEALADDIRRFLEGEPISARPASFIYIVRRRLARNKVVFAVSAAAFLSLVAATAGYVFSLRAALIETERQRTAAEFGKKAAEAARKAEAEMRAQAELRRREAEEAGKKEASMRALAERRLYTANILLADAEVGRNSGRSAISALDACPAALRSWEWGYLRARCHQETASLKVASGDVLCVVFSPDSGLLAASTVEGSVHVWDAASRREVKSFRACKGRVRSLVFSPDGKRLATAGWDRKVRVWNPRTGRQLAVMAGPRLVEPGGKDRGYDRPITCVSWSSDGRLLAAGQIGGKILIFDPVTGRLSGGYEAHSGGVNSIAFRPGKTELLSGGAMGRLSLSGVKDGKWRLLHQTGEHQAAISSVAWSRDGSLYAASRTSGTVDVGDPTLSSGQERSLGDFVLALAFAPGGDRVAAACGSGAVAVFEVKGTGIARLIGHSRNACAVAFSPDGRWLASGGATGEVKLWRNGASRHEVRLAAGRTRLWSAACSADGRRIAATTERGELILWGWPGGRRHPPVKVHTGAATSTVFHPSKPVVYSAGVDGKVVAHDLRAGRRSRIATGHSDAVMALAVSPDGKLLASGGLDGRVCVISCAGGKLLRKLNAGAAVRSLAFGPGGELLAAGTHDGGIVTWKSAGWKPGRKLRAGAKAVMSLCFRPGSAELAAGTLDGVIKVWDTAGGELRAELKGHRESVNGLAYSADGLRLVSAGMDDGLRLWEAGSGRQLVNIGHPGLLRAVTFSPDGRCLICAGSDGRVRVLLADPWREPLAKPGTRAAPGKKGNPR